MSYFKQYRRKQIAELYDECFRQNDLIKVDFVNKSDACYYRYPVVISSEVEKIMSEMKNRGIACGYGVLEGMHQIRELDYKKYPNTERNLNSVLSLPIYPSLTDDEVYFVAETLINLLK